MVFSNHRHGGVIVASGSEVLTPEELDPALKNIVEIGDLPKEGFFYCVRCDAVIGHVRDRIEINGSFDHRFTNPHGYTHHFGCHKEAHGCTIGEGPYSADSWFPSYAWRLANCTECGMHMGWLFEKPSDHFFGIILDHITTK